MKTVRQNVFETNSSSTHSVTLRVNHNKKPTMKPYSTDNMVTIPFSKWNSWDEESWTNKMQFLALYLKTVGREEDLSRYQKMVEDFSELKIKWHEDYSKLDPALTSDDEQAKLENYFGYFINEYYGHESVEDFKESVENLLSNDKTVLAFVCSTGWFDVQGYYDG